MKVTWSVSEISLITTFLAPIIPFLLFIILKSLFVVVVQLLSSKMPIELIIHALNVLLLIDRAIRRNWVMLDSLVEKYRMTQ